MVILAPDGRIEDCSEVLAPLLGADACAVVGQPISRFLPDMPIERLLELVDSNATDTVQRGVAGCDMKGRPLELALLISPWRAPDGQRHCSLVIRNIGPELETERMLQNELRMSDGAVKGARIGVFEYDPRHDVVTVSRIWRELMGIQHRDSTRVQSEWRRRVHPDDLAIALEPMNKCIAGRASFAHSDYRVRPRETARWRWFRTGISVAERDSEGKPIRLTGAMIDITESKEKEIELRRSSEQLRLAFEYAPIGKSIVSLDGKFLKVNQKLCSFLGYTEAELLTTDLGSILYREDMNEELARIDLMTAGSASSYQTERRFIHKSGEIVWGLMIVAVVRDAESRPVECVLQVVDTSEQHRLVEMKSDFVSTVSHELRTPLTSVLGALKLLGTLETDKLSDQAQRLLYIAEQNGHRLHALIDDILDFERFSTGKGGYVSTLAPIVPLVEESVFANVPFAEKYNVTCTVSAPNRGLKGYCDPKRFQQVMGNLLSNASKFARAGSTIKVTVSAIEGAVRVTVSNTGSGIAETFRPSVFKPFSQAEMSATRSRGGTGLGLSICKEIVERGGGTIGFDSTPNETTTFWFTVPTTAP
jgi:PAS domain S-box